MRGRLRAKYILIILIIALSQNFRSFAVTWYTLVSGNWDSASIWTLDPAGMLVNNPDNYTPTTSPTAATDNVVILSGRYVTVSTSAKTNNILTVTGSLDFTTTTGHTFSEIRGSGSICLAEDNFPAGTATHFITEGQGEGTVVYYGTGDTLTTARTFYHVEIDMDNATDTLVLRADYTINGNLTITKGALQINDATTTALSLTVKGTTLIEAATSFIVGSGNVIHNVTFEGDVTNNGTIDFANDAQYNCAASGAVKVTFSGASNNTLTCNGTTDFYRMFVDKGSDESNILSVLSTNTSYFNLFGPVSGSTCVDPADGTGGWERLALVIYNGTLKLGSNIDITRLGEYRTGTGAVEPYEFHIPYGARLWINGADVATSNSGGDWCGITISGTLQVSAGTFTNPSNTGGIAYLSDAGNPAKLVITGGSIYTTHLRQAVSSERFSYIQSGGSLYINALSNCRDSCAVFALPEADHVFEISGGLIRIQSVNETSTNGIHVLCDEGNYNVSGGTFEILLPTLDASGQPEFGISTTVPLYNLTLTESANPNSQTFVLQNDLTILNDLTIGANTELDADGYDLSVGGDFIFEDGATYTHGNNTTRFTGASNSEILVGNTSATAPLQFYNFEIAKDQYSNPELFWDVELASPGRTAGTVPLRVTNTMLLTRGSFSTSTFDMQMYGDTLEITDGTITNDTDGKITLTGSATQHTLKGAYAATGQSFGHVDLNNTNGVILLSDCKVTDITLSAANTLFDLDIYNLEVTNSINGWSSTEYFATAGNGSDGGLTLHFTITGNYSGEQLLETYPVGSPAGYSPAEIYIDGYDFGATSISGSVRIAPANSMHTGAPAGALAYYWVSEQTGFGSVPAGEVIYRFYPPSGISKAANHRDHALIGSDWYQTDYLNNVNLLQFRHASHGIVDGEFTSGNPGQFNNRRTLYSRQSGDWHSRFTWSTDPHGGPQGPLNPGAGSTPRATDICVVGMGHRINATSAGFTIGRLEFSHDTAVSTDFEDIPRVQINGNYTFAFGKVVGTGMFTQWIGTTGNPTVTGDFGDFANEKYSWYLFVAENNNVTMPTSYSVFPNLATEVNTFGWHLTFSQDIHVNYNLNPRGNSILVLNNGATGDIYVAGDCYIGDWMHGKIQFPSTGSERTLTIMGNLDFTQEAAGTTASNYREIFVDNTTPSGLEHNLTVGGNIIQGAGILDLYNSGAGANNVILNLIGDNDGTFTRTGTEVTDLYRIELNKTVGKYFLFDDDFTLGGPTDSYPKALELINGDLQIADGDVDLTLSSGGADFRIPSTASLSIEGEAGDSAYIRISGSNTGLYLDGTLTVSDNGNAYFNGGTNNYIYYSASGNAQIDIYQGALRVGSQIRRSLYTEQGVLKFHQLDDNSTVILGENDAPEGSRGILEILNSGSEFTQADNTSITIVRQQTSPTLASLYLDPGSIEIGSGAGFVFGNASTPASQIMGIYSSADLQNITLDNTSGNDPTVEQWTGPLTINENLTIQSGTTFDANGFDLTINGDLTNSGTFVPDGNTTFFSGTADQTITGSTTFYNLTRTSSAGLALDAGTTDITVTNDLDVQGDTLTDNSNDIFVQGNCNFDGIHIYGGSGDGITFNGSLEQQLTGTGTFGKITIDNPNDVVVPLGYNLSISDALNLQSGVFNIGKNLLSLSLDAVIEGAPFSASNMIQTNISFTDYGVKKTFPAGASTFVYPIGSEDKYTPVTMTITANGNSTGSITVKAADEMHPSIQEDSESPDPEITDADNVLQYHWVLRSSGISGFSATVNMKYDPADVMVTAPYDVYDYITARLLNDGTGNWNKYDDVDKFDETNEILIFNFAGVDDDGISGDYTAGVDGSTFNGAIPDLVPSYQTNSSGNWTTGTIWTPNVSGGPRGAITIINSGHTVTSTNNGILNYTTEINGSVLLNNTYAHRFGEVTGTGRIYSERDGIPAGFYDDFFSATGGTLEYGGTGDYFILGGLSEINNLILSGTGERKFSGDNILLNGDLEIDGGSTLDVICYNDREIEIKGDLTRTGGSFDAAVGSAASVVFSSNVTQTISGDFTGSSMLNILEVDNVNGVSLSGNVFVDTELKLTNGAITTGSDTLTLGLSATVTPSSGTSSCYVNGELTKVLTASNDFIYPVGKSGHLGTMELIGVAGFAGSGNWPAEYYFSSPTDYDSVTSPVSYVSHVEYWSVQGPAGGSSDLKIILDGSSDVANAIDDLADLRFVAWNGTHWIQVGGTPTVTGTATSGTITTGSAIDFDTYQYITLGSIQSITLATASIVSGDATICNGFSTDIIVSLTGTPDWDYTYTDGITPVNRTGITTTSDTITVSPSSTTTYTLTAVSDDNGDGILVGDTSVVITVNTAPTITFTNNTTGDTICDGDSVIFTAGGGTNYDFHVNSISEQSGATTTYTTSALADQDEVFVVVTGSNGCRDTSSTTTITVLSLPAGTLNNDDADNTICYGDTVIFTATDGVNYRFMVDGSTVQDGSTATYETWSLTDGDIVTVEVTNALGCSTTYAGITMTVHSLPAVDLGADFILCVDSSAILDAGAGMTGYAWSTTETTQTISVSAAAEYSVTVTDINGCINSDTVEVEINPMTIDRVITNATCNGYADGAIDITVTGGNTPIAGYLWSNSETTEDITGLTAGSYTVTVTDAQGCPLDSTFTVAEPAAVVPSLSGSDTICQETIVVYSTDAGMSDYVWVITDVDLPTAAHTVTAGGGASDNTITVQWDGYEGHRVSVNYTDGSGCTAASPTELEIWVNKLPETGPEYHLPNMP
ncbi:MAG: hypothetical protein JW723_07840 [Bacteroidales bacterium]|nr:hypothetical protein [Bacteroidales bacterium]